MGTRKAPGLVLAGLTLALSLLPASSLSAQTAPFVLRGGINLSKFVGGDAGATDARRGLNLGGSYRVLGVGPFSFWFEGYYRQKGADGIRNLEQGGPVPTTLQVGIDYIEIPVLLRLDIPVPSRKIRPYLQGGPAFGWKLDCSVTFSTVSDTPPQQNCDDLLGGGLQDKLRNYEQGVVLGGGIDFNILGRLGGFNLDARLTRGLSRLATGTDQTDVRNQSFTLMLGYSINPMGLAGGPPMGRR